MRHVLVLLVLLTACGDPSGPRAVPIALTVENTGPDSLVAWWWRADGTFGAIQVPPFGGRGRCENVDAVRIEAWQGTGPGSGHTATIEHPRAGMWIARPGPDATPTISPAGPAPC